MANTYFAHEVLNEKIKSMLDTKVSMSNYMTVDDSLTAESGMKIKIQKYSANDNITDVAEGVGNSDYSEVGYTEEEYEVITTQGRAKWTDEAAMRNPIVVDTLLQGQAENMVNNLTRKAIAEMDKATKAVECDFASTSANYFFNKVVDALALVDNANEDESGYTLLISPNQQAYIRKQLGDALKYVEANVRTGYIGSVAGVPVVMSKAVKDNACYLVNPKAITYFSKKGVETEEDRDKNTRTNIVYIRKVGLVALTDANYIVMIAKPQGTAAAITTSTKNTKTIAGTCGTDCYKVVVVDGKGKTYEVVPSAGAWTLTADENLASGDVIVATAYAAGYAPKTATITVS